MLVKKYLIFLRGINVGENKRVPMKHLEEFLKNLGYNNVKTHNNTGNVYLESGTQILLQAQDDLEKLLRDEFGFEILLVVRDFEHVEKIAEENIFRDKYMGKNLVGNVSFLEKPSKTIFKEEQVLKQTDTEIFWIHKKGGHDSPFEKTFEKKIGELVTTRTWTTVEKCVKMGMF